MAVVLVADGQALGGVRVRVRVRVGVRVRVRVRASVRVKVRVRVRVGLGLDDLGGVDLAHALCHVQLDHLVRLQA